MAVAVGPAAASAPGGDGRDDNSAVAMVKRDGASVFRSAFQIVQEPGGEIDNRNIAYAYASCEDCDATAIAFQVVLVTGPATSVTPPQSSVVRISHAGIASGSPKPSVLASKLAASGRSSRRARRITNPVGMPPTLPDRLLGHIRGPKFR